MVPQRAREEQQLGSQALAARANRVYCAIQPTWPYTISSLFGRAAET